MLLTLANLEGDESFDPANLGSAEEVSQEKISDEELILIKGAKNQKSASIILRGANSQMLDEMERSLHDSLCIIQRTLESGKVVPGGGAVEAALSIYLENFATTLVLLFFLMNLLLVNINVLPNTEFKRATSHRAICRSTFGHP